MKSLENFEIPEEVFEAIEIFDLIEKKDRILISYSGGPDSTFLTYVLLNLKKKFFLEISLFYLFHKLEGSLSPEKAREFASNLGLKIFIFKEDIRKFAKDNKLNIEEAGRIKRYTLLNEVSEKEGFNKIATAHTLNDALETFLLRFLREGFSLLNPPIKPKYKKLIRPLILTPRDKIIKILKDNDISYHIDIENYTLQRTRNKIRHILIPEIFREFNFSLSKFKKFYIRIIEESKFYEENIKNKIKEYIEEKTPFFVKINREKIKAVSSFEKRELLKNILFEFGFEEELKRGMLLSMEEIFEKGGKIEIKKDLFFVSKGDYFLFMKKIQDFEITLREGE
ncbi:MAG: tRNA lysidine(34) synthetase TilS, partial [candidate division WOR-3 bacterium]